MGQETSYFTGLSGVPQIGTQQQASNPTQPLAEFPASVLDICMSDVSDMYDSPRDIGKIRFRNLMSEYNRPDKECVLTAYPLDRSIARYPFPGEQVIVYTAFGDSFIAGSTLLSGIYYYTFVVSTNQNITFNANPFLGVDAEHVAPINPLLTYNQAKKRFDKKIEDLNLVKDSSNKVKIYKQLQPSEGDFILQGRFGNTIRFGSTSATHDQIWSTQNGSGISGDGIVVMRVDRDYVTDDKSMLVKENIDTDDASIYMCTSQTVNLTLACSKNLKSWKTRYNLKDNAAANSTLRSDSSLWKQITE
jgi:hypothetical protein